MSMTFQVAGVTKPLASVKRITAKGNVVGFGPDPEDNYIMNKKTGLKMPLKPNGKGSYLMEVKCVGGGPTWITVDSGAEESVCPWEWGAQFGVYAADSWMSFKDAQGGRAPAERMSGRWPTDRHRTRIKVTNMLDGTTRIPTPMIRG